MTATTLLGPAELRPILADVIARHPDATNPTDLRGRCLYTAPDDAGRHCLIGQVAAERVWGVPGDEAFMNARVVARRYGWPVTDDGAEYLRSAQERADEATDDGLTWSAIELPT